METEEALKGEEVSQVSLWMTFWNPVLHLLPYLSLSVVFKARSHDHHLRPPFFPLFRPPPEVTELAGEPAREPAAEAGES
jgi:hypothetical protein